MAQATDDPTTNVTELRPKADPTGAQRQARFRKRRKAVVTVPDRGAATERLAPPAPITPLTPPPNAGRVILPVTAARNGGAGVTVATMVAALALATVSGGFSINGMTAIFTGALYPVVGMGIALELGKLSAVAWLGRHRGSPALRGALTILVVVLMGLNAVGAYGFLAKAHIVSALAGDLAVAGRAADIETRITVQAGVVGDLDRRIAQIDKAVDTATNKGRTGSAMALAEQQRKTRGELTAERIREGKVLATLQVEKAAVDGERRKVEADLGPVRYLATLVGAGDQDVLRWFILVVACLLDPAAILLLLAATRVL
jgi:hypothetical protein